MMNIHDFSRMMRLMLIQKKTITVVL